MCVYVCRCLDLPGFQLFRTFDQFANLLVEHIVERHIIFEEKVYADIYLGTMLIRGENVCLFGEVDPERQDGLREAVALEVLRPIHL